MLPNPTRGRLALLFAKTPLRVCAVELDRNELDMSGLKQSDVNALSACKIPGVVLFQRASVGGSKQKGYSILEPPNALGASEEKSVATLLDFLGEQLASTAGFDLELHLNRCFAAYWEEHELHGRLTRMRAQLLEAASAPPHQSHPIRFLSMWLADPSNAPPPPAAGKPQATVSAAASKESDGHGADHAEEEDPPPPPYPEELIRSVLFSNEERALAARQKAPLDKTLRELMAQLRAHLPREPFKFLARWLHTQPLHYERRMRTGSAAADTRPDLVSATSVGAVDKMNHSEVVRCWPAVRKAVVGSPILAEVRKLIDSILKPLLRRGLPIDSAPFGYSMLYMACAQGNLELAKLAVVEGADLHRLSKDGTAPLEVASALGHVAIVSLLLEQGAHFASSAHYASAAGQAGVVEALLKAGCACDVAHTQPLQQANAARGPRTPLELALAHGHTPVVLLLLSFGANPDALPAHRRDSPLLPTEARKRTAEELSEQVSNAASFYQLQSFLKSDRFDDTGADVTSKPVSGSGKGGGEAGGAQAVTEGSQATSEPLPVELDPNACDTMGWTGLMHAAVTDDAVTARKLLSMGAKHTYRNRFSLSALLWAHWMEASSFREVLRQLQGAEADTLDGNDQKGFDRLRETLERHKGDAAVKSLLRPTGLRKGGSADAGGASQAEKQEDGIQQTKFVMQNLIDEVRTSASLSM